MESLQQQMRLLREQLSRQMEHLEGYLVDAPPGQLRIAQRKNQIQYYWREKPGDNHGTYIRKTNSELIQKLAQKEYYQKLLPTIRRNLQILDNFLNNYQYNYLVPIYEKLVIPKQNLVIPLEIPEEKFIEQWQQVKYQPKAVDINEEDAIITEKGEIVRSKSEKILADRFTRLGIPYHYEKPLKLKGFGIIYPDFTLLNVRNRKTIYWEHFGLMDDPDYCEKAIKKPANKKSRLN